MSTPFTPEEKSTLNQMILHAAEKGDVEGLKALEACTKDPERFRQIMATAPKS